MNQKIHRPLIMFLFSLIAFSPAATVTITSGNNRPFDGWGTAICWWGNVIGGYSEKNRDSIVNLIFDTASGLGLNIIRYNIGGGDAPGHSHMGAGKEMEGFWDGADKEFNWERDKNQRAIMEAARNKIDPAQFIAEAFSNSPPHWMTGSGCASGAASSGQNLKSEAYGQFARYLCEVVRHFKDSWGITFQTLEPFNEPMGDWWNVNGGQEGCSFSRANQAKMLKELSGRLSEMKLTTRIAASDEAGYDEAVATYNAFDSTTRSLIRQINTHGYSGSKRADLRKLADRDRKKLWASEIDGSGAPAPFDKWTHNHNDIAPGLDIANRVIRDIRDLQPDGWIFWQAVESEQAQISLDKNWGCIHADFTGGERFYICKKFHALRQFTRFIRPGSTLIGCTENEAVAFISPAKDRLVIVQRNGATSPVSNTYTLGEGILPASAASAAVWRTSADENFAHLEDIHLSGSAFTASLKAQSITSFVIPLNCGTATENSSLSRSRTFPLNASIDSKGNLVIRNGSEVSVSVEFFSMSGKRVLKAAAPPGVIRFNRRLIGTGSAMILRTSESSFHAHSSASKGAACAGLFLPTLTPRE